MGRIFATFDIDINEWYQNMKFNLTKPNIFNSNFQ
jgi:hypothetical protein